jgi:hypothetical protein
LPRLQPAVYTLSFQGILSIDPGQTNDSRMHRPIYALSLGYCVTVTGIGTGV